MAIIIVTILPQDAVAVKSALIAEAEKHHEKYPQYRGHWSGPEWKLLLIRKDVKTKLGVAFRAGDVVLGKFNDHVIECGPYEGQQSSTCYSRRNKCDTAVRATHVQPYKF